MAPVGLRQDGAGYPARQTKLSDYRVIIPLSLSLSSPIFRLSMFSIVSKRFYQRSFGIALSPPLLFRPCIIFSTFYSIKLAS